MKLGLGLGLKDHVGWGGNQQEKLSSLLTSATRGILYCMIHERIMKTYWGIQHAEKALFLHCKKTQTPNNSFFASFCSLSFSLLLFLFLLWISFFKTDHGLGWAFLPLKGTWETSYGIQYVRPSVRSRSIWPGDPWGQSGVTQSLTLLPNSPAPSPREPSFHSKTVSAKWTSLTLHVQLNLGEKGPPLLFFSNSLYFRFHFFLWWMFCVKLDMSSNILYILVCPI